ncbi:MAG: 6-carboxytetrahydropterin synthase [Bacteroidetes bacterium]|nr:6-carboxytetrahydropterin synthase [Bacteroidota bacterium]
MSYITRKEHFNAAHKLCREDWTDQQNHDVFGKCANKNFHGHNFNLYVTVKGEPDPETGFIINLKELSILIKEKVVDKLDHQNMNLDVDFLKGMMPSIENVAVAIWQELNPHITAAKLHCIRLQETDNNYVEYFGE